jgi:hypothetical protein
MSQAALHELQIPFSLHWIRVGAEKFDGKFMGRETFKSGPRPDARAYPRRWATFFRPRRRGCQQLQLTRPSASSVFRHRLA